MRVPFRLSALCSAVLLITACGGGGSDSSPTPTPSPTPSPTPVTSTIEGYAVKGPLANATVSIHRVSSDADMLAGAQLGQGSTDEKGQITGLQLEGELSGFYIIKVSANDNTIDTATGKSPALKLMFSIISAEEIASDAELYITPLSTLTVADITASLNKGVALETAIVNADERVGQMFGYGSETQNNPRFAPSMVDGTTSLQKVLEQRTAVEAYASQVLFAVSGTNISGLELTRSLGLDINDGILDGSSAGEPIELFTSTDAVFDRFFNAPIAYLRVTDTDKDGDDSTADPYLISEVNALLIAEQATLGSGLEVTGLETGSVSFVPHTMGADFDSDGYPDYVDDDIDGDGVLNDEDAFPTDPEESLDTDGDGIGNNADVDDDNDGVADADDAFPLDDNESADSDGDGIGNNADSDDDNDGVLDENDAFPTDPEESEDADNDGTGDNADYYDNDPGCFRESDGNGTRCYLSIIRDSGEIKVVPYGEDSVAYLNYGASDTSRLVIQSLSDSSILSVTDAPYTQIAYVESHNSLYLGDEDGNVVAFENGSFTDVALVDGNINGLASAGNYLAVHDESGAWGTLSILDGNGTVTSSMEWLTYSGSYGFDEASGNLYYFRDDHSPNDILFSTIDQQTGAIINSGDSPYHGDYTISPPLLVSSTNERILLGSGDLYKTQDLIWAGNIGSTVNAGYWTHDNNLVVAHANENAEFEISRLNLDTGLLENLTGMNPVISMFESAETGYYVTDENSYVRLHRYVENNDSDGDGVVNVEDAFPTDVAASVDSDNDGYPDAWNTGYSAANSTTGLTMDSFPDDSACWLETHGVNGVCDYSATMPDFIPDEVAYGNNGIVYLYNRGERKVFRFSTETQSYLNPFTVGEEVFSYRLSPSVMMYSEPAGGLLFGYSSGKVTLIADGETAESDFYTAEGAINALFPVAELILVQTFENGRYYHSTVNAEGERLDKRSSYLTREAVWNRSESELYFIRIQYSNNDFVAEAIDAESGEIFSTRTSAYNFVSSLLDPVEISFDGNSVIFGDGSVFDTATLSFQRQLSFTHNASLTVPAGLITWSETNPERLRYIDTRVFENVGTTSFDGDIINFGLLSKDGVVVTKEDGKFGFYPLEIADSDSDGMPGWWETLNGLNDDDNSDAAEDADNDGLTNLEELTHSTMPNTSDTDNDGLSDGDEVNTVGSDPLKDDSDGDGLSDGREVNDLGTSPLSVDSDEDGLSDFDEVENYSSNPLSDDTDSDGLDDAYEVANGLNINRNDASEDADSDGVSNGAEFALGTDPQDSDSDNDGFSDGQEVTASTNPLFWDTDNDHMADGFETQYGFDPLSSADSLLDSDGDGFANFEEYYLNTSPIDTTSVPAPGVWNQHAANDGHSSFLAVKTVGEPQTRWQKFAESDYSLPAVMDAENIYSAWSSSGQLVLTKRSQLTGEEVWQSALDDLDNARTIIAGNERIYVQNSNYIAAVNKSTGQLIYQTRYSVYHNTRSFLIGDDFVFMDNSSQITRLNQNGGVTWTSEYTYHSSRKGLIRIGEFAVSWGSVINLYDLSSGQLIKSLNPESGDNQVIDVIEGDRGTLLARDTSRIFSIDIESGEQIWALDLDGVSDIAQAYGVLFVNVSNNWGNNALLAVNESTGTILWTRRFDTSEISSNIAVSRNHVFVQIDNRVYGINAVTGQDEMSLDSHYMDNTSTWSVSHLSLTESGGVLVQENDALTFVDTGADSDGDGIRDWWELRYGYDAEDATDASSDLDSDGLTALEEYAARTHPGEADSDGDGLSDGVEVDTYASNPLKADSDNDGLSDNDEVNIYSTSPTSADSDNDGISDGAEVAAGLSPSTGSDGGQDSDNDGVSNLDEYLAGTGINDSNDTPADNGWSQFKGNSRGTNHVYLTTRDAASLLWSEDILTSSNSVRTAGYLAFLITRSGDGRFELSARNMFTGDLVWQQVLDVYSISDVFVINNDVHVSMRDSNYDYQLRLFDATTGEEKQTVAVQNELDHNVVTSSLILPSVNALYAFNTQGAEQFFIGYNNSGVSADSESLISCISNVAGEYDSVEGSLQQTYVWEAESCRFSPVIVANDLVLVPDTNGATMFNRSTGQAIWRRDQDDSRFVKQPVIAGRMAIFTESNIISAVDILSGDEIWSATLPDNRIISTIPVSSRNRIYVGTTEHVYGYDHDGALMETIGQAANEVTLSKGILFIRKNNQLYAYDVSDDQDGDGLPLAWELAYGFSDDNAADATLDGDSDGLTNAVEYEEGTNPTVSDSDNDGLTDGSEVNTYSTDPIIADTDSDGLKDGDEVSVYLTDPLNTDSDGDGFSDGNEVSLYGTDPNDADSLPDALTSLTINFDDGQIPTMLVTPDDSDEPWDVLSGESVSGVYGFRSGDIDDYGQSSFSLNGLFATGTLTFKALLDSESCCDRLEVYVNGEQRINAREQSWQSYSLALSEGQHLIEWKYVKDGSVSRGRDAAFIDDIVFSQ